MLHPFFFYFTIWVFPKIGVPQNGWLIMENLIKMDDLGAPLFSETSIMFTPPSSQHSYLLTICFPTEPPRNNFNGTRLSPCLHDSDRDPRKRHEIRHRYGSPSPGHPWRSRAPKITSMATYGFLWQPEIRRENSHLGFQPSTVSTDF